MAVAQSLINLFPGVSGALGVATSIAAVGLVVAGAAALVNVVRRKQARHDVRMESLSHGLCPESANFLVTVLGAEGSEVARALLRSPELMRQRLAGELGQRRRTESASRFATACRRLCEELRVQVPAFPGSPVLFEELHIGDANDPDAPRQPAWLVHVNERHLGVVTLGRCAWPVRQDLSVHRREADDDPFVAALLLRPVPGCREWVLAHDLLEGDELRRSVDRVPCRIAAWTLPATAGTFALRGRLQSGEPLDPEALRKLGAWPKRHSVTVEDISAEGARLEVEHDVGRGDRFYLVLSEEDGNVAALPLAEVISIREGERGRAVLGTRFCAVRLKERVLLADYARKAQQAPT